MRVLVTGGTGAVGRFVVRALLEAREGGVRHDVTVFDATAETGHPGGVDPDGVRQVRGDIRDLGQVYGALHGADAVIHLAGLRRPGIAPDDDDPPAVLHRVGAPVPHVERVHAVVGVARAVQVAVPVVVGVALLVLLRHHVGVGRVGEHLLVEVDVARVVHGMELVRHRVVEDGRAALPDDRLVLVQVEEVSEPE